MNIKESKPFLLPLSSYALGLPGIRSYIVRVHQVEGGVTLAQDITDDFGNVRVAAGTFVSKPGLVVMTLKDGKGE